MYETEHGNTGIAYVIGEALSEQGDVRATPIEEVPELDYEGIDLLVFGAPTQRRGLSSSPLLESLPKSFRNVAALACAGRVAGS
ncbi:MAG: hypothetical protein WKF95_15300 [Rubrobacter sp.]